MITLLTDFGTADYFVAAMKGVILSRDPDLHIVDITHDIPPQDVRAAAFTLLAVYDTFPAGAVHVAVVDPGVGSGRRAIVVSTGSQCFVGPDNGLLSYVLDREPEARIFRIANERYFRRPLSSTFHGRDVFAPVAASLASGAAPMDLGPEIGDAVRLEPLQPKRQPDGTLEGSILHIDRFGNCITGFTRADLPEQDLLQRFRLDVGGREIRSVRQFYAESNGEPGEIFAIWGSAGFIEIAANGDSAARLLGIERGQPVHVREKGPERSARSPA